MELSLKEKRPPENRKNEFFYEEENPPSETLPSGSPNVPLRNATPQPTFPAPQQFEKKGKTGRKKELRRKPGQKGGKIVS
jgi:hypothetical protein